MTHHEPGAEYDGPATLTDEAGGALQVEVKMRGEFQPLDGRFHWWGRVLAHASHPRVEVAFNSGTIVSIDTGHGVATGRLSDLDPWGRYRIAGLGKPPF
ncbi:DUF4873 domain-containing protein [Nocardioides speluncae]|uniref:DUF4873 domain-containing protein n=1 Tax=Nocardioides speluncae TaxID=2670337 RepID=UPI000D693EC7|nr:DUF4873 domain-containing protein [Nocardioides speluncae]